jgi:Spy/CpxP family protein refolding chaperone
MLRKTLIALTSAVVIAALAVVPNVASARGGGGGHFGGFSGGHGGGHSHGGLDLGTAQPAYNCTHWYGRKKVYVC